VERLTVQKAAERLGISVEAVRQQVRQDTLPHGKWPDGGVYVCMEGNASGDKAVAPKEERHRSLDFAQASAMVAIVASATYALGLLSVWIPLSTAYPMDLTTAWYLAALVPRLVVVGQGIIELLVPPIIFILVLQIVALAGLYVMWLLRERGEETSDRIRGIASQIAFFLFFVVWAVVFYVPISSLREHLSELSTGETMTAAGLFYSAWFVPLAAVFLLRELEPPDRLKFDFCRFAKSQNFREAFRTEVKRRYRTHARYALGWSLGLFFTAFLLGLSAIIVFNEPPLPTVDITKDSAAQNKNSPSEIHGVLLVHTEGVWHVLEKQGELIAIPDDEVKTVRVHAEVTNGSRSP
jgi:hypothetical protein